MHCQFCLFRLNKDFPPILCNSCISAHYCSETCRQASWEIDHYCQCSLNKIIPLQYLTKGILLAQPKSIDLKDFYYVPFGKCVGKGAYGKVIKASCIQNGMQCAMKIINKQYANNACCLEASKFEIQLHSSISHSNIIQSYGYTEDDINYYLVMEYADTNLFQYARKNLLTETQMASIFKQVCNAIYFLHLNGFVHRDVKPENILMKQNIPKIGDFGCATRKGSGSLRSCGTVEYLPPEELNNKANLSHSYTQDIWALGILLYELKYGKSPFKGSTDKETASKISKAELFLPEDTLVNDLIRKLLKANPGERLAWSDILTHPWVFTGNNVSTLKTRGASIKIIAKNPIDEDIAMEDNKPKQHIAILPQKIENKENQLTNIKHLITQYKEIRGRNCKLHSNFSNPCALAK